MRAIYRLTLAVTAACLSLAVGATTVAIPDPGPATTVSPDEHAIYEAVLNSWLGPKHGIQLVNRRLGPPPAASAPDYADCAKGLSFAENPADAPKEKILDGATFHPANIELVDRDTWRATDPDKSIGQGKSIDSAVSEAFSKSLITFSQVSFSSDGKDALVQFGMVCGRLCGTGFTLQMHKSNDQWASVKHCNDYMS
jgi:hypothetical protein